MGRLKSLPQSLFFVAVAVMASGCFTSMLVPANHLYARGEKEYNEGNFEQALIIYDSLLNRGTKKFKNDDLLFRIGECYLNLNAPADAREAFVTIKVRYPGSDYLIDVDTRLAELANRGDRMLAMQKLRKQEAEKRLREARKELSSMELEGIEADSRAAYWLTEAAEALWDLERYEDARDAYVAAINITPDLRYDPRIQGRLIFPQQTERIAILSWLTGGPEPPPALDPSDVIPMTPQGELRWPGGQQPLVIYNTTLRYTRVKEDPRMRYALVTGQVKNQSNYTVRRASVEVSLTNVRDQLLDVRYTEIPRLEAKATAAFSVRLGPFDDAENISSYSARVLLSPEEIER